MLRPQGRRNLTVDTAHNARVRIGSADVVDLGGVSQGAAIVGHNHPAVIEAIRAQLDQVTHIAQTFDSPIRDLFLERLHRALPPVLDRTFLANSGTEGMEAAIKMAMAATGRSGFVAAKGGFHGRSMGALSLMDREAYRGPFEPRLAKTRHVPFNDPESLHRAIDLDTAALVVEPVQGEGGVRPADEAFLRAARDLTEDRGALLVLDEVQTGLGRTGAFLAADRFCIEPDIVVLGKGLAGGLPIGATVARAEVAERLPAGTHGSTYGGSPLVCAAGAATLEVLANEGLPARAGRLGTHVATTVTDWELPVVREVRGRGLMVGIDLRVRAAPYVQALQEQGCMALTAGPTVLRLLPPLTIDEETLDDALANIHRCLAGTTA